jgi:hypothetical protein
MSIRAVDFQILVPKTQKLAQENHIQNSKLRMEYQHVVQQDRKNIDQQFNQINSLERKKYLNIKKDEERKNKSNHNNDNQYNRKKELVHQKKNIKNIETRFDMRI